MAATPANPRSSAVFERTYRDYLSQIDTLDLSAIAARLGARESEGGLEIALLGEPYQVTRHGIAAAGGRQPDFSVRLILLKYILLCPPELPPAGEWIGYRGFKDSGPLTAFFPNTVEKPLADHFSGRLLDFDSASQQLGGEIPPDPLPYDRCYRFTALPRIPLLVTLNDQDSDFAAHSTILFRASADRFLDPECLAILGGVLSRRLIAAA